MIVWSWCGASQVRRIEKRWKLIEEPDGSEASSSDGAGASATLKLSEASSSGVVHDELQRPSLILDRMIKYLPQLAQRGGGSWHRHQHSARHAQQPVAASAADCAGAVAGQVPAAAASAPVVEVRPEIAAETDAEVSRREVATGHAHQSFSRSRTLSTRVSTSNLRRTLSLGRLSHHDKKVVAEAMAHARHYVLHFQFKRKHNLDESFSFPRACAGADAARRRGGWARTAQRGRRAASRWADAPATRHRPPAKALPPPPSRHDHPSHPYSARERFPPSLAPWVCICGPTAACAQSTCARRSASTSRRSWSPPTSHGSC